MRTLFQITGSLLPSCSGKWLQRTARRFVVCPYYHTVSDTPLPHITPLYRHRTVAEFRADLDWLTAHYEPIRWSEIDDYERAQKPAFCLTFDDRLKEFYTVVAPVLEEMHRPCLCFLNSAFVDNKDLMFRYREALAKQGIDWKTYLREQQPYMTSAQIRDLQARGFEFGSHSVDHPYFYQLPISDQLAQTLPCDAELKQQFGLSHRLFAYPFGQGRLDRTVQRVHMGTHEAVFGTANLRPGGRNMYNRIAMEDTRLSAQTIIHGEYVREIAHLILHD